MRNSYYFYSAHSNDISLQNATLQQIRGLFTNMLASKCFSVCIILRAATSSNFSTRVLSYHYSNLYSLLFMTPKSLKMAKICNVSFKFFEIGNFLAISFTICGIKAWVEYSFLDFVLRVVHYSTLNTSNPVFFNSPNYTATMGRVNIKIF